MTARMPIVTRTEAKMINLARNHVARYGYPTGEQAMAALVHALQPAIAVLRPADREPRTLPGTAVASARALAPSVTPSGPPASSAPEIGRQRRLQALLADPTSCAVIAMVVEGCTNPTIALRLALSPTTVKRNISSWLTATDCTRRAQLANWAEQHGVLPVAEVGR